MRGYTNGGSGMELVAVICNCRKDNLLENHFCIFVSQWQTELYKYVLSGTNAFLPENSSAVCSYSAIKRALLSK